MSDERPRPCDPDAERQLLGGLINEPNRFDDVAALVSADDFYQPEHGRLFMAIRDMRRDGDAVDPFTLDSRIGLADPTREKFGGHGYVSRLFIGNTSTANISMYARNVRDRAERRRMLDTLEEAIGRCHTATTANEVVALLLSEMSGRATDDAGDWMPMDEAIDLAVDLAMEASRPDAKIRGVMNPLDDWARLVPVFTPGDVHVIAARPSMGKTALARRVVEAAGDYGRHMGETAAVFSLEDSAEVLAAASLSSLAETSMHKLLHGKLDDAGWSGIAEARNMARGLPVVISRSKNLTIAQLVAKAHGLRRSLEKQGRRLNLLAIDHLGLIKREPGDARRSSNDVVGDQSREVKLLAMALDVPVIELVQLNRDAEKAADPRPPRMSDLRDSGRIEEDATTITFVHRDKSDPDALITNTELIVAKNKKGPIGTSYAKFHGPSLTFRDHAKLDKVFQ